MLFDLTSGDDLGAAADLSFSSHHHDRLDSPSRHAKDEQPQARHPPSRPRRCAARSRSHRAADAAPPPGQTNLVRVTLEADPSLLITLDSVCCPSKLDARSELTDASATGPTHAAPERHLGRPAGANDGLGHRRPCAEARGKGQGEGAREQGRGRQYGVDQCG